MDGETFVVKCERCDSRNRVRKERIAKGGVPICARCKAKLPAESGKAPS